MVLPFIVYFRFFALIYTSSFHSDLRHDITIMCAIFFAFEYVNCMFPVPDMQGKLYTIMEICRMFDGIYKEHLDGMYDSTDSFSVHCL